MSKRRGRNNQTGVDDRRDEASSTTTATKAESARESAGRAASRSKRSRGAASPGNPSVEAALAFLNPLGLAGIVVVLVIVAGILLLHAGIANTDDQHFKFLEYGLFGLLLAISLLALAGPDTGYRRWAALVFSMGLLVACGDLVVTHGNRLSYCAGFAQVLLLIVLGWLPLPWTVAQRGMTGLAIFRMVTAAVVLLAAWTAAVRMPWWVDFIHQTTSSFYYGGAFAVCLAIAGFALYWRGSDRPQVLWQTVVARLWDAAVVIVILLASFRLVGIFNWDAYHHWGMFVAPAEMVRQGGWLLWDVPSQYGFLSILTVAWLPVKSAWTGFHVIVALCQTVTVSFIYLSLASMRGGWVNRLFAAMATIPAAFLMSTMSNGVLALGPQIYPSTESYRFAWAYAGIATLCGIHMRTLRGKPIGLLLVTGCVCWIIGIAWSCECAYYATATWIPAYYLLLWQKSRERHDGAFVASSGIAGTRPSEVPGATTSEEKRTAALSHSGADLPAGDGDPEGGAPPKLSTLPLVPLALLPPALLLLFVGIVYGSFHLRLGHGPDWYAYTEYVHSFQQGFGEWQLDQRGGIWVAVISCLAPATLALALFRQSRVHPGVPLLIGASAMVLAVASYCMGRSHPNNVLNILPFCILAASLAVRISNDLPDQSSLRFWVRACVVPGFVVLMAGSVMTTSDLRDWLRTTFVLPHAAVQSRMPRYDDEANDLLAKANVSPTDPLFVYDLNVPWLQRGAVDGEPRTYWTPYTPLAAVTPISHARATVYLERFARRTHASGWMLIPRGPDLRGYDESWIVPTLFRLYTQTRTYQSANYLLVYLQYKGDGGSSGSGE